MMLLSGLPGLDGVHEHSNRTHREHPPTARADSGDCPSRARPIPQLDPLYDAAIRDTIERFEATGSPVITDGEQRKYHNFWTYSRPWPAEHGRRTAFRSRSRPATSGGCRGSRSGRSATGGARTSYLETALRYATVPVKQAVISPSALSLMYPHREIDGYPREQFISDLLHEHETEVRSCLQRGAHNVQIDFTEGRLAVKVDPSGQLLHSFVDLNNLALGRFSTEERQRIGIHTCPGGDCDSTHSADVDYAELLPSLFELNAGTFLRVVGG